jgi:RNase P subunit RPR2
MQTIIFLLILFLISIFSILLYYKNKHSRVDKLNTGECPDCGQKTRVFYDENTKTTFKSEVISTRLLKGKDCSGVKDIEYTCKSCGLKEVYSQV